MIIRFRLISGNRHHVCYTGVIDSKTGKAETVPCRRRWLWGWRKSFSSTLRIHHQNRWCRWKCSWSNVRNRFLMALPRTDSWCLAQRILHRSLLQQRWSWKSAIGWGGTGTSAALMRLWTLLKNKKASNMGKWPASLIHRLIMISRTSNKLFDCSLLLTVS